MGGERSLVAVTAKTNRSKADQDPSTWLPPLADARCTYAADWVATKLRWSLTADQPEAEALMEYQPALDAVNFLPAPESTR
nr:hypothetical protein [Streptomyces sp. Root55]